MVPESPGFQPHPERDEQETEHEQGGDNDEDDQARVRVLEQSDGDGNDQRDEDDGAHRRQQGAGHGQRMARQSRAAGHFACLLEALHVGDERVDIGRRQLRPCSGMGGFLVDLTSSHCGRVDNPRLDVVGRELRPTPSSGLCFPPLPAIEWQVEHFCAA